MPSTCPKCHQVIADDDVCCADVRYTWKCRSCGKLTSGFVVPYGRCFMCGGENVVVEEADVVRPEAVAAVQEAVQYELEMYQFYRLGLQRTRDMQLRAIFEELYSKEQDHLDELESKYHVHLDPALRTPAALDELEMARWLFEGIDFDTGVGALEVYDRAIAMERRTRDYFAARAEALTAGAQRETYRELAAEEAEHVSLLEGEREQFVR